MNLVLTVNAEKIQRLPDKRAFVTITSRINKTGLAVVLSHLLWTVRAVSAKLTSPKQETLANANRYSYTMTKVSTVIASLPLFSKGIIATVPPIKLFSTIPACVRLTLYGKIKVVCVLSPLWWCTDPAGVLWTKVLWHPINADAIRTSFYKTDCVFAQTTTLFTTKNRVFAATNLTGSTFLWLVVLWLLLVPLLLLLWYWLKEETKPSKILCFKREKTTTTTKQSKIPKTCSSEEDFAGNISSYDLIINWCT